MTEAANVPEAASLNPRPIRVLCVDDNRELADTTQLLLNMQGYFAKAHYAGRTALEDAREFKPDVCLIDLHMPGMAGDVLAAELLKLGQQPPPILIALTAMSGDLYRVVTTAAGFRRHLVKPVEPQALVRVIEEELQSSTH